MRHLGRLLSCRIANALINGMFAQSYVHSDIMNRLFYIIMKQHTLRSVKRDKGNESGYSTYEHKYWFDKGWLEISYTQALKREKSSVLE